MFDKDGKESDRMSGSQFDYDQGTGVAQAQGSVDIEMTPPLAAPGSKLADSPVKASRGPIHVQTSGLTFNQKTQVASTDQTLTFEDGAASGSARGASYDGDQGTLVLRNDVVFKTQVSTADGNEPVTIKAQGASYNSALRQLVLIQSFLAYQHEDATADQSTVYFRQDGSADHVNSEGHVHVVSDTGGDLKSGNAYAQLDSQSQLQQLRLTSGLLLIVHPNDAKTKDGLAQLQTLHADSDSGTMTFGPGGALQHLQLVQAVSVVDQEVGLPGDPHGSETRELRAAKVDVNFAPADKTADVARTKDQAGTPRFVAKDMLASGDAKVTLHTIHATAEQQSTTVQGDQLFATLLDGHQISSLRGNGHTYLLLTNPGGVSQTGSADTLQATFAAAAPANKTASILPGTKTGSQIVSAEQQGHVTLAELQPSKVPGAQPIKTNATADRVTYDGVGGKIQLIGSPHISQDGSDLTADALEFNRITGDATASGGVKATYAIGKGQATAARSGPGVHGDPSAGGDAVHVVAARATLNHAQDETTFFGAPHADARLWQGPNSVTAPTIILARTRQLLTAKGPAGSVTATFAENGKPATAGSQAAVNQTGAKTAGGQPSRPTSMMRIISGSMIYSGGEHKASFSEGVAAQGSSGTLHADDLEVDLTAGAAPNSSTKPLANQVPAPGGRVDKLIASGHVDMQQGGRRASGAKLVYTTEDQRFVLTGSSGSPPRVTDPMHGTVTGGSLIFNNRDDSVIVSRGQSATVTDTHTTK
jgi:lipopolysaccharide export system protein LptA